MALALEEEKNSVVVKNESQTMRPLLDTSFSPLFPRFEMRRRAAESKDRHPVAIHFGDIAQVATLRFARSGGIAGFEQLIESISFLLFDEARTDAGKKVLGDFLNFHFPCSCQRKWSCLNIFPSSKTQSG